MHCLVVHSPSGPQPGSGSGEGLGQEACTIAAIQQVPGDPVPPGQPEDLSPESSGYFPPPAAQGPFLPVGNHGS